MAELFRFRCYGCQKLMGAPASKFGKLVNCPRCGVELVVPIPDDSAPAEDPEAETEEDLLGLNLADEVIRLAPAPARKPAGSAFRDPNFGEPQTNPIAFLESTPPPPGPASPEPVEEDESPAVAVDVAPKASLLRPRKAIPIAFEQPSRRRDVVLPRTVVLAWALGALLGLGFAFLAGLLIGHYLW